MKWHCISVQIPSLREKGHLQREKKQILANPPTLSNRNQVLSRHQQLPTMMIRLAQSQPVNRRLPAIQSPQIQHITPNWPVSHWLRITRNPQIASSFFSQSRSLKYIVAIWTHLSAHVLAPTSKVMQRSSRWKGPGLSRTRSPVWSLKYR